MPFISLRQFAIIALLIAVSLIALRFPCQASANSLAIIWAAAMLAAGCTAIGSHGSARNKYVGFLLASGIVAYWEMGSFSSRSYTAQIFAAAEQVVAPNEFYVDSRGSSDRSRFFPDGYSSATSRRLVDSGSGYVLAKMPYSIRFPTDLTPLANSVRLLTLIWLGMLGGWVCDFVARRSASDAE